MANLTQITAPAVTAQATLSTLNFVLRDFGSAFYIQRPKDRGGMTYYAGDSDGATGPDYFTGMSAALVNGAAIAQAMVNDETVRAALPQGNVGLGKFGSRSAG